MATASDESPVMPEDVQELLYLRARIARGLEEAAAGKLIDHDEIERRIEQWRPE